ncbi:MULTISPECIES: hybrid sensor histidine kinase/response regulator [unclassified Rhizobium]|uniref:ATP-binding response regulator n=1 Tax=unclassified Rhizobium TaxID=2613769 RepID=UPI0027D3B19D|nr:MULTISPECIES: ATP-binding protein [unclassified Rhizobium]MDQ4408654.1 ATP-binding protein [Rhizobium sp. AN63]
MIGIVRDDSIETARSEPSADIIPARLVEQINFGLAVWNEDGRLLQANRYFNQALATFNVAPPIGSTLVHFLTALASSRELVLDRPSDEWVDHMVEGWEYRRPASWSLADGRYLDIAWQDVEGGVLLIVQDSTVTRQGERLLHQAKSLAEDANSKKSRFLHAANHDLRQPLSTLKILTFNALELKPKAQLREILKSIDAVVDVMEDLIGALLQIGQLDAGKIAVRRNHFQSTQILERLNVQFSPIASQKGLEFRVVQSFLTLESDQALLERILSNLVANAIRFTENGKILIGVRRRGHMAEIQVWDTGCGIATDQLDLIFQEFHQVDSKSTIRQRGLGLGLNIAKRLSDIMEHKLRVVSSVGHGSMFAVEVPVGDIWQSKLSDGDVTEGLYGEFRDVRVLVVEDDERLRAALQEMLLRWGIKVLTVSDRIGAQRALVEDRFDPDIVLIDYSLRNGETGTEILRQICEDVGRDIPAIVCTANTDPVVAQQIRDSGTVLLIKPVSPARLRSIMHHLLYEKIRSPL